MTSGQFKCRTAAELIVTGVIAKGVCSVAMQARPLSGTAPRHA